MIAIEHESPLRREGPRILVQTLDDLLAGFVVHSGQYWRVFTNRQPPLVLRSAALFGNVELV